VTSEQRRAVAQANGRAGRGRKSAAGKASSARNALRHGLSVPLGADPVASAEVAALARAIVPPAGAPGDAGPELAELARRVAEAQLDLLRVRRSRHDLIAAALGGPDGDLAAHLAAMDRYERRARSRRKRAIQDYDERRLQMLCLQSEVNFGGTKPNSHCHRREEGG
jgi:hypothetical protein